VPSPSRRPDFRGWRLHGDGRSIAPGEVVAPDERLTWPRTIGIGVQHVIAMFGATFLVPLLTGFDPATTLFFTGAGTLLFLAITAGRLPSYLGSSFALIAPIGAVTGYVAGGGGTIDAHRAALAQGGVVSAGAALLLVGVVVHLAGAGWIDRLMPPIVTGAIVSLIGFNLAPSAWNNVRSAPVTALVTIVSILLITVLFKGMIGRLAILIGVLIGYATAVARGEVDFSAIAHAGWVGAPAFRAPAFDAGLLGLFIPVVLVLVAENIGHVKSVSAMTGEDLDGVTGRALLADGLSTMLAGSGGGSGTTTRTSRGSRPGSSCRMRHSSSRNTSACRRGSWEPSQVILSGTAAFTSFRTRTSRTRSMASTSSCVAAGRSGQCSTAVAGPGVSARAARSRVSSSTGSHSRISVTRTASSGCQRRCPGSSSAASSGSASQRARRSGWCSE